MSMRAGLPLLVVLAMLAGCLDMFLDDEEDTARSVPAISWTADDSQDRISVLTAASSADWSRLTFHVASCAVAPPAALTVVAGTGSTSQIRVNAQATSSGAPLNTHRNGENCGPMAPKPVGNGPQRIMATDYVEFCTTPTPSSSRATQVEFVIRDVEANAIVYIHHFVDLAPC